MKIVKHENIIVCIDLDEIFMDLKKSKNFSKILFSPGNPSGKDFKNFIQRGKYFKSKVLEYFSE